VQAETVASGAPGRGQRVVWQALQTVIAAVAGRGATPDGLHVLDCGGGTGSFAVPLAAAGARVTVVDISVDALATLQRRAAEAGVADRVRAVQADVEALGDAVAGEAFDLVLAHGILEVVDDLPATVRQMAAALRGGGVLSVLIGNPVATVLAHALSGDLAAARDVVRELDARDARSGPAAVRAACGAAGLVVAAEHGAGVFADLVPGAALDQAGAADVLVELEAEASGRHPFIDIATRVHVLATRSG
jgi:SAM-dependent methyltransferase